MGGCQNYGPFLGTLNIRGRIIIGTQKGTIILTTTHIEVMQGWCMDSSQGVGNNERLLQDLPPGLRVWIREGLGFRGHLENE